MPGDGKGAVELLRVMLLYQEAERIEELIKESYLTFICRQGAYDGVCCVAWPPTCSDSPASASKVWGLEVCSQAQLQFDLQLKCPTKKSFFSNG